MWLASLIRPQAVRKPVPSPSSNEPAETALGSSESAQPLPADAPTQRSFGSTDWSGDDSSETPTELPSVLDVAAHAPREADGASEAFDLPRPGDLVGGTYEVISEIGRGSMGVVLSAFDRRLERAVAIKLIRAELLDSESRQRFLAEARVMAQINHPNVVCIHALGEHGRMLYFVMELVEGTNLDHWHRHHQGPVELTTAAEILNDVCLGVSAIHAAGAVHRDLKPSNILLDAHLRSRVADFGVSTRTKGSNRAGAAGTPGYMAPEVVLTTGEGSIPLPQSDVYSLACIAYQLLTGVHPFLPAGAHDRVLIPPPSAPVVPASRWRPDLPSGCDRVLAQALAWDVAARTKSVEAFRRELVDALRGDGAPERVLIAEDDPESTELMLLRLRQEFPNADIECVDNGRAALEALERRPASIALLDLQMPEMDGATLTAHLRRRDDCANMPIIVLTASGGAREWQRLSNMGADRFLVKPVQLDDVMTLIRQALRERGRKPVSSATRVRAPDTL
jgi:serine/threonine protein kinase